MTEDGTVLIFGGVGGIGEALARRLAAKGARVAITSRSLARAQTLASEIGTMPLEADVGDEAAIRAAVETASGTGGLTGLAYCVGSIPLKPFNRTSAEDFVQAYRLNVVGAFLAIREAAAALRTSKGSVVLFSTVAVRQGFPNHAAIASAKGGVEGLTVSLAAELAPDIRVNAIAPSLTDTPLAEPLTKSVKMAEAVAALHAIPRLGTAADMAAAAAFLLSREAGWITGQVLGIDGGRSTLRTGRS